MDIIVPVRDSRTGKKQQKPQETGLPMLEEFNKNSRKTDSYRLN